MSKGVTMGEGAAPASFSEVFERFQEGAKNSHLRESHAKGLYSHKKFHASTNGVRKFFLSDKTGVEKRKGKRLMAAMTLLGLIDSQFGSGKGEEVFKSLNIKARKGVTVGDLTRLNDALSGQAASLEKPKTTSP